MVFPCSVTNRLGKLAGGAEPGWSDRDYPSAQGAGCICAARAQMITMRIGVARGRHSAVHHQAGAGRHVRHGGLDALARLGGGHGGTRSGRERVRRRRGDRAGTPGGRAAPEWPGRRGPGDRLQRPRRRRVRHRRPGASARRRDAGRLRSTRHRPDPWQRAARRDGAGGIRCLDAAAERYGTLRLRDVMSYAIGYAADGYPMLSGASAAIDAMAPTFTQYWPTSAEIYLGDGTPAPGSRFANQALAETYSRVLAEAEAASGDRDAQIEAARHCWYEGFVAEAIEAFVAGAEVMDVTGRPNRGLLAAADLAAWRASVEEPVTFGFRGLTVCKTGPWGQGPVFCQQLAMLDGFDLAGMGPGSAELIHVVTEVAKLAFADREAWYGDPRHSDVPLADLLSPEYAALAQAAGRRARVGRPGAGRSRRQASQPCLATRSKRSGWRPPRAERASRHWVRQRWARCRSARAIPVTWTSPTGSGTWSPPPRAAAGCRARRWCPGSASAWAPGRRCSRSALASPARSRLAGGRGRPCRPASSCATASRTWRSARRAATSRISGRWGSS